MSQPDHDIWSVLAALNWLENYLGAKGEANPRLSAQLLLSHVTGLERIQLYLNFDQPLDAAQRQELRAACQRRATGEPLQYIISTAPFYHLEVAVEPGVLIPRPETETLVQLVLEYLDGRPASDIRPLCLDVGCGSGNIALALASERAGIELTATDISERALELARRNAQTLGLEQRIDFLLDDLATNVLAAKTGSDTDFSVLVSNPPYIPSALLPHLPREVRDFEPQLALDGGRDGLDVFYRLAAQAPDLLVTGGLLALELFEDNVAHAAKFLNDLPFRQVQVHRDLNNRPRFLTALRA